MAGTPFCNIARVNKARGLEGKVTVHCADGLPFCMYEGLEVHVVPPTLYGVRRTAIATLDELGDGTIVVRLEGVNDVSAAEELSGRFLLAARADLDLEPGDDYDELLGRQVVDENRGPLGTVTEVIETLANDCLVINGPFGEVLIPLIEEMVVEIPEDLDEPIVTCAVEGLIG